MGGKLPAKSFSDRSSTHPSHTDLFPEARLVLEELATHERWQDTTFGLASRTDCVQDAHELLELIQITPDMSVRLNHPPTHPPTHPPIGAGKRTHSFIHSPTHPPTYLYRWPTFSLVT